MSTNYPTSKDTLVNPTSNDTLASVSHSGQHSNANDAIEALEDKVGVNSSSDSSSIDYKLTNTSSVDPGHKHTKANITDFPTIPTSLSDLSGTLDDITDGSTYVKSTNDYTDAEKTKLSGIETGAEVNNISDVNATDLTDSGASTLHYHASDRARANHTGTQTASTISDFDTEVSNNTDVAANTSARHSAVTVTDSTEIDFTLTGQDITASLKSGSIDETKLDTSVNASLDLADTSLQTINTIDITVGDILKIGDGTTGTNKQVLANNGDANLPALIYNESTNKWQYSNDGTTFSDMGTGGGGAVDSVNGLTGTVVLDPDDLDDTLTAHKFVTATDLTNLSNLSGTNTGDQDLSSYAKLTDTAQNITANSFITDGGTSGQFVKGDGSLDSTTYLTSLSGAVLTDQTSGQTIGDTTNRLTKLWATDITVTNAIAGSVTGNAGTVTNGIYTTSDATALAATSAGNKDKYLHSNASTGVLEWSTVTGGIDGSGTANEIPYWVDSNTLGTLAVATYPSLTELSYVKGVTSAIQTQLNAKGVGDMLLGTAQSVTETKTFTKDKLLIKGTSTGTTNLTTANTSATSYTATLPAKDGTLALVGGSDTQVQFNDGGSLNGDSGFIYDKTGTGKLTIGDVDTTGSVGLELNSGKFIQLNNDPTNLSTRIQVLEGQTGSEHGTSLEIYSGDGNFNGSATDGGAMRLYGGTGFDGNTDGVSGSYIYLYGGDGTFGKCGNAEINGGNANSGTDQSGGDIVLIPGRKYGSGTAGKLLVRDPTSNFDAILNTSSLATSDKIFTFPNRSITFDNITTSTTTNGTGFLKGNGSVISFDNSTYLTSSNIEDSIVDGHTTIAPSGNAVFDALALKAPLTSPTFATSINGSYLTASEILITDGSKNIVSAPVATYPSLTELSYVKGVTSAIQTQIGNLVPKSLYDANTILYATTDNTPVALTVAEQKVVGRVTGGAISTLSIDSDLAPGFTGDSSLPSSKAAKAYSDTKISNSLVDAKGDLITASADNTPVRLAVGSDGYYPIADSSQTTGLKYKAPDGWNEAFETWEYVSVDDPTGIFRVNADVTGKYSAGMRIKFTNGGNIIKGIITVVSAYGAVNAGYTHITFLHEIDPTDSLALVLMANSAITANYYSTQKAPLNFPLEQNNWSVKVSLPSGYSRSDPVDSTWYNMTSINLPIGSWKLVYSGTYAIIKSGATLTRVFVTLSTANNSEIDKDNTAYQGSGSYVTYAALAKIIDISLTTKTPYYLNIMTITGGAGSTLAGSGDSPPKIKATCAYL